MVHYVHSYYIILQGQLLRVFVFYDQKLLISFCNTFPFILLQIHKVRLQGIFHFCIIAQKLSSSSRQMFLSKYYKTSKEKWIF